MGKASGGAPKKGRTWDERKKDYQSIAIRRDVAKWAAAVARDEGLSVAELVDPLLRGPLGDRYRALLQREMRATRESPPGS